MRPHTTAAVTHSGDGSSQWLGLLLYSSLNRLETSFWYESGGELTRSPKVIHARLTV
jgi:hypothetical protein